MVTFCDCSPSVLISIEAITSELDTYERPTSCADFWRLAILWFCVLLCKRSRTGGAGGFRFAAKGLASYGGLRNRGSFESLYWTGSIILGGLALVCSVVLIN